MTRSPIGRSAADRRVIERLLKMLPAPKASAYRPIDSGDSAFCAAYLAADKDLPICEECGRNTEPLLANASFGPEYWSRCCHARIEQDAGREP